MIQILKLISITIIPSAYIVYQTYQYNELQKINDTLQRELDTLKVEKTKSIEKLIENSQKLIDYINQEQIQNLPKTTEIVINHNAANSNVSLYIGGIIFIISIVFGVIVYYTIATTIVTPILTHNSNSTLAISNQVSTSAHSTDNLIKNIANTSNNHHIEVIKTISEQIQGLTSKNFIDHKSIKDNIHSLYDTTNGLYEKLYIINENIMRLHNKLNYLFNEYVQPSTNDNTTFFNNKLLENGTNILNNNVVQYGNDNISQLMNLNTYIPITVNPNGFPLILFPQILTPLCNNLGTSSLNPESIKACEDTLKAINNLNLFL